MKDFGNDTYSGDCFDIVGKIKGLDCKSGADFVEILRIINQDLGLGMEISDCDYQPTAFPISTPIQQKEVQKSEIPKKTKPYSVVQQLFSTKELAFWQEYGVTQDILKTYKVVSLKEFHSENNDGKPFTFYAADSEPIFGYQGNPFANSERMKEYKDVPGDRLVVAKMKI
jgi:hypothetical protein